jgi:hypothetical protein
MVEKTKLILPVWVDITAKEVSELSLELCNRSAVIWTEGPEQVAAELARAFAAT